MGRAGVALKQVLETYGIAQNQLAVVMGIRRSSVHRWVNELADPVSDAVLSIRDALEQMNPEAAEEFTQLYWGKAIRREE
jgi:plasmid maintenance system antidote protein VapI